jgi:hypothetical protein
MAPSVSALSAKQAAQTAENTERTNGVIIRSRVEERSNLTGSEDPRKPDKS